MPAANLTFDVEEVLLRLFKYILEGLVVAVAAFFLPTNSNMPLQEVALLGLVAAATFSILDMFAPSIGASARNGAGFGLGAAVVGGIPLAH